MEERNADFKKLQTFDKYQKIWFRNIQQSEQVREKMNSQALCKNFKVNKLQAEKGDMTIMDRVEMAVEKKRNKDLCDIAFRPGLDHNENWYCSLRQGEHDNEFDGLKTLGKTDSKNQFHKRRSTFDQSFVSEDD